MNTYLYNKNTGKLYRVMNLADGIITLKNELAEFSDTYNKDLFQKQGYIKVEGEDEKSAIAAAKAKLGE